MNYYKTIKGPIEDCTPDELVIESDEGPFQDVDRPRKPGQDSQEIYDLMDKIEMPTSDEKGIFFLKGKKNLPVCNMDYKNKGFVSNLNHKQMLLLVQEISKQTGIEYCLPSFQSIYEEFYGYWKMPDKEFKKMLEDYFINSSEILLREGKIIFWKGVVMEVEGELKYDGESVDVEINDFDDILEVLSKPDLFKRKRCTCGRFTDYPIKRDPFRWFDKDERNVRSTWSNVENCLYMTAISTDYGNNHHVVALKKF